MIALLLLLFASGSPVAAADSTVASAKSFATALAAAQPGDVIRVADGRYEGWELKVPPTAKGAAEAPIRIIPESQGGVTFSGRTNVRIRGDYIEFAGFLFEGTGKNSVTVFGHHNRIGDLVFRDAGDKTSPFPGIIVIHPGATDNEIDHNQFFGSTSMSIKVRVRKGDAIPTGTHIHHNLFQDIVRLAKNGQEPIQLGQGGGPEVSLGALVEYNHFLRVNADPELISSKTSGNIIRYNLAVESNGVIVLRTGRDCVVEGNVLLNTRGGIRISGTDHRILNNFVSTVSGRGIVLTDGTRRYRAAKDNIIAHNTVISNGSGIVFAAFDPVVEEAASGNLFVNNIFVSTTPRPLLEALMPETLAERLSTNSFENNLIWWQAGVPESSDGPPLPAGFTVADPRIEVVDGDVPTLMRDSPAIDAAAAGYAVVDIRSLQRPSGRAPDIGAFEAQ